MSKTCVDFWWKGRCRGSGRTGDRENMIRVLYEKTVFHFRKESVALHLESLSTLDI